MEDGAGRLIQDLRRRQLHSYGMNKKIFVGALALWTLAVPAVAASYHEAGATQTDMTSPTPAVTAIRAWETSALQADLSGAVAALQSVAADQFDDPGRVFRDCVIDRFHRANRNLPRTAPFDERVLGAYRAYWRTALTNPASRKQAEKKLIRGLNRQLNARETDINVLEGLLKARLAEVGIFSLQGKTGPIRELMIWRSQTERIYPVELPESNHSSRVFLLDNFASMGWTAYATCDRRVASGWATRDALYAVVPQYGDFTGEDFQVNF